LLRFVIEVPNVYKEIATLCVYRIIAYFTANEFHIVDSRPTIATQKQLETESIVPSGTMQTGRI